MRDIYFEKDYGRLYEQIENGVCEVFEFQHPLGKVNHLFIKRPISMNMTEEVFYDITTPYGYGGPRIIDCEEAHKSELVQAFQNAFKEYCQNENIICEFVRFHPLFSNAKDFEGCYELTFRRFTTGTNLKDYEDPIKSEFSRSKQKSIQKALNAGVEYRIIVDPPDLENFKRLYYETMKRRDATSIYYFDDAYFNGLLKSFGKNIIVVEVLYEGKVIASGLNFVYEKFIHIHLSGTTQEHQCLSSAFVMRYALVLWGKEHGMELIHEGGGLTGNPDDSLYLFKKQFGKNTEFPFYVSYKIWNQKVYDLLCKVVWVDKDKVSFPAYRSKPLNLVGN
ncbi:MAG: peptidoglycan bridge formation glycyltransferase FemA/FemB family protein [Planococcus sp. (in: firmicutes)]|uniref:peptidoglycan bridge formation glycyltransferase FemA/FemB family protein n=1 Tax=Planococcus halocryophilus TaxID=1215089 RepID=UPI001F0FDFE3|nr:peptidoglycan bridge formation glycyltransferase FemA/FemB family protein [Planococcus halocryophilus]MCH4827377.1 peptidoglycan bridge formation glycyltransferase FemA/FemB family protein [Planococcus halocryophilus]